MEDAPTDRVDELDRMIEAGIDDDDGLERARVLDAVRQRLVGRGGAGPVLARYEVLEQIGSGGMGVVYAARDPELDRKVAIKLLRPDIGRIDDKGSARLLREARAVARLSHPNVVAVYDVGVYDPRTLHAEAELDGPESGVFVVMELIAGVSLHEWLQSPRPWRHVLAKFVRAGRGLAAAHAAGLTHRDFKPQNVLVGTHDRVAVVDFGLARSAHDSEPEDDASRGSRSPPLGPELTEAGRVMGTPPYMSPEQHSGKPADPRSDQYSFCASLYRGLYGQLPFRGENVEELVAHKCAHEIVKPGASPVPERVWEAISRGLQPHPDDRFSSMNVLLDAIRPERHWSRVWIAVGGAALIGGSAVVWTSSGTTPELCQSADEKLAGVWDAGRRAAVETSFGETNLPYASDTASRVDRSIEAYVSTWRAEYVDACQATHVAGDQPGEILDLRMRCLNRNRDELRALVEVFGQADVGVVRSAVSAVASLPSQRRCADVDRLRTKVAPPDPEQAQAVEEARASLARANALGYAAKFADGLEAAEQALAQANTLGYPPVRAEALSIVGWLAEAAGELARSEQALTEAVSIATVSGHDRVGARAANHLVYLLGYRHGRYREADLWAAQGEALLRRAGPEPELEAMLLSYRGTLRSLQGRNEDAQSDLERAVALFEEVDRAEHSDMATVLNSLGSVMYRRGKLAEAKTQFERALTIYEKTRGPEHPDVVIPLDNLGVLAREQEDFALAKRYYDRALAIDANVFTLAGMGESLMGLERLDEAVAVLERCLELVDGSKSDPEIRAEVQFRLASALWANDADRTRARELAGAARDIYDGLGESKQQSLAMVEAWLASHPQDAEKQP